MQVLRGESDPLELFEEDEDDEDFVLDWDEVMGTDAPLQGTHMLSCCPNLFNVHLACSE